MRRAWTVIAILVGIAAVAGLAWLALDMKFEIRVVPYDDPAVSTLPADQAPADPILQWIGWGFAAVVAGAVAFTVWAVVKQMLLIRNGRPDSR